MRQLVVDAGPLIALFVAQDNDHAVACAGFEQLLQSRTEVSTPLPIVTEVYKWLLHNFSTTVAQRALVAMQTDLQIVYLAETDFGSICSMMGNLPDWRGTIEDASVIWLAQRQRCPVWTLNYRDFGMFKHLEFWNPVYG